MLIKGYAREVTLMSAGKLKARTAAVTLSGAHDGPPSRDPQIRGGGGEHGRDGGEIPLGMIPIVVPLLAVLLAVSAYMILGAVL